MKRFALFAALFLILVVVLIATRDAWSHNGQLARDGCHTCKVEEARE